jgi:HD-GYP domain-containing protein (c-di-GMP phosphodiesterase class II)
MATAMVFAQTPTVDELVQKGVENYKYENYKTAYELFRQAMKQNPNHPEASKWFWKMKKEHNTAALSDKGSLSAAEPFSASAKAGAGPEMGKSAPKDAGAEKRAREPEIKTIVVQAAKTDVLDRKMSRIDEKIAKLYEELKTTRDASRADESRQAFAINLSSPLVIVSGTVGLLVVLFFLMMFMFYRARVKRIPAPPAYEGNPDIIAKKIMERMGIEESEERKLLALQSARKLLAENPQNAKNLTGMLTRLSLDSNEAFSRESRRLLEIAGSSSIFTDAEAASLARLPEKIETYTEGYLKLLESKYKWDHSRKVRVLAKEIGLRLGLSKFELKELEIASLLQNVGFIRIPDAVLNKKSQLNKDEMTQILMHPEYSAEIVGIMNLTENIIEAVRAHHERYNGNGYPSRLSGTSIPLYARIIGLCDSFAAITSQKPFREPVSTEQAVEILKKDSFLFDPEILKLFLEVVGVVRFSEASSGDAMVLRA